MIFTWSWTGRPHGVVLRISEGKWGRGHATVEPAAHSAVPSSTWCRPVAVRTGSLARAQPLTSVDWGLDVRTLECDSMRLEPRRDEYTICTAVAPDDVFVRTCATTRHYKAG